MLRRDGREHFEGEGEGLEAEVGFLVDGRVIWVWITLDFEAGGVLPIVVGSFAGGGIYWDEFYVAVVVFCCGLIV